MRIIRLLLFLLSFGCFTSLQLLCLRSDVGHHFLQGMMLVAASLNRALVDLNHLKYHQNQELSNDELHDLVDILNIFLVVNDLYGVNHIGGAAGHFGRFAPHLRVLRPCTWFTSSFRPSEFCRLTSYRVWSQVP